MAQAPLTVRRWKRSEYERLVELGAFERDPIELVGGQIVVAEPQSAYHAGSVRRADYALRAVLPAGWVVRVQSPVSLDDDSEPEPDLAVAAGRPDDYLDTHPAAPVLVRVTLAAPAIVAPVGIRGVQVPVARLLP